MWEAASDGQLHPTYLKVLSIFWVPITNLLLLFLEIFSCPRTYPTHVLLAPGFWLLAPLLSHLRCPVAQIRVPDGDVGINRCFLHLFIGTNAPRGANYESGC
jgi:hypothetical protein